MVYRSIRIAFQTTEKNSLPQKNEQPKGACGRDVWEGAECQPWVACEQKDSDHSVSCSIRFEETSPILLPCGHRQTIVTAVDYSLPI